MRTAGLLLALAACSNSAGSDIPPPPNGGTGGSSGPHLLTDGGSGDVMITLVNPMAMAVLKGGTSPEVRAKIVSVRSGSTEASSDPIDGTSVRAELRETGHNLLVTTGPLFATTTDEFAALFDLSKAATGDYLLVVLASTVGGSSGRASIPVRVDNGPNIVIVAPAEKGAYKGSVTAQVLIDSAPFNPTMSVDASIGPWSITLTRMGTTNVFEAPIDFLSFSPPLMGDQVLRVTATNAQGTMTTARATFTIDNRGPTITSTEPKEGSVVGGIVRLRAKVEDPAGVLGNTVIAVIGNSKDATFTIPLKAEAEPGFYSEVFDTNRLTRCPPLPSQDICIVFPNLSFRASDVPGNESTVAYDLGVDNQPPTLDLFPPPDMRVIRFDQQLRRLVCSWPFDPLGDYSRLGDMPNDGCAVPQVFDLRARIEDQGNRAEGLKNSPISGIDPVSTGLYILPDTSQPLVVDVDGDGACDAINPKLVPTTKGPMKANEVMTVRLAPVPPKGNADFTPDPALLLPEVMAAYPGCTQGTEALAPRRLCGTENLPIVIGYPAAIGPNPAIWALEPISSGEPMCVGSQFDVQANDIPDGWVCIAAAARDQLGNSSVSAPLRVWVQRRGLPETGAICPSPPASAGAPPNCTGTFDRKSGNVTGGTCRGRAFPARERLNAGALPEMTSAP